LPLSWAINAIVIFLKRLQGGLQRQKKSLLLKKHVLGKGKERWLIENLDIIAPLPRFWASRETCTPFLECSALNTSSNKATHIFAKEIVSIVLDMLNLKIVEFQKIVMEKLLCLPCLHLLLPGFFQNQKQLQQCATVWESIFSAWSGLKYGIKEDKYVAHNIVLASSLNSLQAGKCCLGMNKIIIHRAHQQKKVDRFSRIGHKWVKVDKNLWKNGLTQSLWDLVFKW